MGCSCSSHTGEEWFYAVSDLKLKVWDWFDGLIEKLIGLPKNDYHLQNTAANLPEPICEDSVWGFLFGWFFILLMTHLGRKILFSVFMVSSDLAWCRLFLLVTLQLGLWKSVNSNLEDGNGSQIYAHG